MCGRKKRRERSPLCFDRSRCRLHRQCRVKMAIAVRGLNFQRNHLVCHRYIAINGNAHNSSPTKLSVIICLNNCKCRIPCSDYRCLAGSGICRRLFWVYLLLVRRSTYVYISPCFGFLSFFCFFSLFVCPSLFQSLCVVFLSFNARGCWCAYGLFLRIQ